MKRLWMRLGLLAGIVGTGGAGVLVANRSSDDKPATEAVADAGEQANKPQANSKPIAFGDTGTDADDLPSPGAVIHAGDTESRYGGAPVRPAADYSSLPNAARQEPTPLSVSDLPASGYGDPESYSNPIDLAEDAAPEPGGYAPATADYAPRYGGEMSPAALPTAGETYSAAEGQSSYAASIGDGPPDSNAYTNELQQIPPPRPGAGAAPVGEPSYTNDPPTPTPDSLLDPPSLAAPAERPQAGYDAPQAETYSAQSGPSNLSPPASLAATPLANEPQYGAGNYGAGNTVSSLPRAVAAPALAAAAVGAATFASDTPGDRQLEGVQTPTLALEKKAPSEVSVGQEATFELIVRNVGDVVARGVVVTDRVPDGTQFVDASPEFTQTSDGAVAWLLGDIEPGDRATITMELLPLKEGELGSIAQVSFQAQASVRTVSTKPSLEVTHDGPEKVLKGEDVIFNITLRNPGTGVTTGVIIEEDVPEGLVHLAGSALEYEVGTLRPGEEKKLRLVLKADKAQIVKNVLRARADAGLETSHEITLEVVAPDLQVAIAGPKTRYLNREVTYEIAVANPGTATAYDVGLTTTLPRGLKFVSADNKGSYDSRNHAVYWSLAELQAQDNGSVKLTAMPIETGEQKLRLEGNGNLGLQAEFEHTTTVQALTELAFSVQDTQDPIEVNAETTYEIRVVNNGNKSATNVQLAAVFPAALTPLRGDGPTKTEIAGQQVIMAPIDKIAGRDEVVYRIAAKGISAGDHIIAVQIISDEVSTPVVKQESTKVYADQ